MPKCDSRVLQRDELQYISFGFDALALNGEVDECFGAEVSLPPKLWNQCGSFGCRVKAFEHDVVELLQWTCPHVGVPDDLWDESRDCHDNLCAP